jgi:hypothetical protein
MNGFSLFRNSLLILFLCSGFFSSLVDKNLFLSNEEEKPALLNDAPILIATGNQIYCPGSQLNIVTNMSITDPDDTGIDAIYIQISSGYVNGQDVLTLTGTHPTIVFSWDALTGKLTLTGSAGQPTYADLISAIEDVVYSKEYETIQKEMEGQPSESDDPISSQEFTGGMPNGERPMNGIEQVLKNMIDNHDDFLKKLAIGLGVVAAGLALLYGIELVKWGIL